MTTHAEPMELMPATSDRRLAVRRAALVMAAPLVVYALARPLVGSDAVALGIGGAIPVVYSIALAASRRRVDPIALLSAVGFSLACFASVLTGGSSLPLKLHEAAITFAVGLVMLVAVLIGRPLALARALRTPAPTKAGEGALGTMIGGFLILHALLHLALAVALPTGSYVIASRVVNGGTLVLGVLALSAYVHRLRARADPDPPPLGTKR